MTETMTAEQTTDTDWSHATDPQPAQNLPAAVDPAQQVREFSLAVRRMLGLEDASDGEIELFFHVCQKSGLDPFNKEVYMIGRNTEVAHWEPVNPAEPDGQKRKVMRWVTKYTIQTSINGFRKKAREIADQKGVEYRQDDPLWCGEDGVWKEVWTEAKSPVAAKFVVYRDRHRYPFIAHFSEFVQTNRDGGPNSMWKKMPCNQIRKCAEAGAIQAAFPDELGGLLLDDAVQNEPVVIDEDGNAQPEQKTRQGGRGVGGLRDRAKQKTTTAAAPPDDVVEGEVVEPTAPADTEPQREPEPTPKRERTKVGQAAERRLFTLLGKLDPPLDREDRILLYRQMLDNPNINSTNDIESTDIGKLCDQLYKWSEFGGTVLEDRVRDAINAATIAAENQGNQS
ncbi:phage recombination protein Bet [Mycobacterium sp. C3-094]